MNFTILKIVIGFAQRCYCLAVQSCYGHFFCRLGKTGGIHEKGIGYRCHSYFPLRNEQDHIFTYHRTM